MSCHFDEIFYRKFESVNFSNNSIFPHKFKHCIRFKNILSSLRSQIWRFSLVIQIIFFYQFLARIYFIWNWKKCKNYILANFYKRKQKIKIQNPESRIQNPESRIQFSISFKLLFKNIFHFNDKILQFL